MTRRTLRIVPVLTMAAVLACGAGLAPGDSRQWGGQVSTDWYDSSNWGPPGGPAVSDALKVWSAPFGRLPETSTSASVEVGEGTGLIHVKNESIVATFRNVLSVGWAGDGEVIVEDAARLESLWVCVGNAGSGSGGAGSVTVRGSGTVWHNSSAIWVGNDGNGSSEAGTVLVEAGAAVDCHVLHVGHEESSTGNTVTIDGDGSSWTTNGYNAYVGYDGTGMLYVTGGAELTSGLGMLGKSSTSRGNGAIVGGSGSLWDTGAAALYVGNEGTGALVVEAGGSLSTGSGSLGVDVSSTGNIAHVTGDGSTWDTHGGDLNVGTAGSGELTVEAGASVSSGAGYIGRDPSSDSGNRVRVTGTHSTWDTGGEMLYVGYSGTGELSIQSGGTVTSGTGYIGRQMSSSDNLVSVMGSGSAWLLGSASLYVGGSSGSGDLEVLDDAAVSCGTAYVGYGTPSVGTVVLAWGGTWSCSTVYVGVSGSGTVTLDDGGELAVSDSLNIGPDGRIDVEGGTLSFGTFGEIEGTLNFSTGTLHLTAADLRFASGEPLGSSMSFQSDQALVVDGEISVAPGSQLTASGGSVRAGELVNEGTLSIWSGGQIASDNSLSNAGNLTMTDGVIAGPGTLTNEMSGSIWAGGAIDASLVNYGTVSLSGVLTLGGATTNYGTISVSSSQTLRQDGTMANRGLIDLMGGAIAGGGSLTNEPGGVIRGGSGISAAVTNRGLIHANGTSTLLLGDLSGGNAASGELRIDDGAGLSVLTPFDNAGVVRLLGGGSQLAGEAVANTGTIVGLGRVANDLDNDGQVRAAGDGSLILAGAITQRPGGMIEVGAGSNLLASAGLADNQGTIVLRGGAFDNNARALTNSGLVTGSGTLRTGGLTNDGHVGVAAGGLDVIGPVLHNGTADVQAGAAATFYGSVAGPGSFGGAGEVVFLAGYSPGSSPGVIDFGGDLTFGAAGALKIELANADNSDPLSPRYDALAVAGDLHLAGTLAIDWLPIDLDATSRFGGIYTILSYHGTRTGTFAGIDSPLSAYLDDSVFEGGIEYDDASGEIKVHLYDLLDGDADLDGLVSRSDLLDLRTGHDTGGTGWALGDFDFDGTVDAADYLLWKAHVGSSVPGAVPEPATLAMLAVGALALAGRRPRFGRKCG